MQPTGTNLTHLLKSCLFRCHEATQVETAGRHKPETLVEFISVDTPQNGLVLVILLLHWGSGCAAPHLALLLQGLRGPLHPGCLQQAGRQLEPLLLILSLQDANISVIDLAHTQPASVPLKPHNSLSMLYTKYELCFVSQPSRAQLVFSHLIFSRQYEHH